MKNLISLLMILVVISGGLFAVYQQKQTLDPQIVFTYSYCDQPITYRIDTVDPKFGLSRDTFMQRIDTAVQTWNNEYDKPLFQYHPQGDLSINLIYDSRQNLESKISELEDQIDADKTPLQTRLKEFNRLSTEFKQKADALNQEIEDWNRQGGAPPEIYDQLTQRQKELQQEADKLNELAGELRQSTTAYNSQITKLNQTVDTFNEAISVKPEEGIFRGDLNRIEIYFNISQAELTHTITHELGHALGIPHNTNPKSIMYPSSTQTLTLTNDDLEGLAEACRRHSIFEPILFYINVFRQQLTNQLS